MLFRTSRVVRASPQLSAIFLRVHCRACIVIDKTPGHTSNLSSISTVFFLKSYLNLISASSYTTHNYYPVYCQLEIPIAMATASEDTLTKVSTEGKSKIIRQSHPLLEAI